MSKATHSAAMQMAQLYAIEHPEIQGLVDLFTKMSEHPKAMCKIDLGTYNTKDKSFSSKLISNIRFAKVLFSTYGGNPIIHIRNNSSENICILNLSLISKIYHSEKRSFAVPRYDTEVYAFHYGSDDYILKATFDETNTHAGNDCNELDADCEI